VVLDGYFRLAWTIFSDGPPWTAEVGGSQVTASNGGGLAAEKSVQRMTSQELYGNSMAYRRGGRSN
jgi:hypothetical protein